MSIVLKNQVEATEKSADELLQKEHRHAMFCYDVRDLLRSIVNLFGDINADVRRWQEDLATSPGRDLEEVSVEWLDLYRRLNNICQRVAPLIRDGEQNGPQIDGKREFLVAWKELRAIVCFPLDRIAVAAEQVKRGEMKSLGEVRDALCNSPVD